MSAEKFVKDFYDEKQNILASYVNGNESTVSQKINSLGLSATQSKIMKDILDDVLTDALYTILLGLSGCSAIGDSQTAYRVFDEENNEIDADEIEGYAWSYFQE